MVMREVEKYLPVADFYAGKSVFITGVTGFVGKVLLEKLLYSCENIDKIYVLIRDKKNLRSEARLIKEVVEKPIFTRLKLERPQDLNKIVPVVGDLTSPNLGVKLDDQTFLEKISVVFHVAANIKYNEKLDLALDINLEGTRRVLSLCRGMKRLESFVHISSVYCNTDKNVIDEVVYPPPAKLDEVHRFIKENGVDNEKKIKKILNGRANTYMFSKALAENLVADHHSDMPTIIVRPSIVSPSIQEPLPGWIDNWSGATGLVTLCAKGYNRVVQGRGDNIADLIPVDYLANLIIVSAARYKRVEDVTVYNCCTSSCNPISFKDLLNHVRSYCSAHGFNDVPYPMVIFAESDQAVRILSFILQKVPAFLADSWLKITKKRPRYMKLESRVAATRDLQKSFTSGSWVMQCGNTRSLSASLSSRDRELFPCDPKNIDWVKYMKSIYFQGITRYMLKK